MQPIRILMVDDDDSFRRIAEYNLKEWGLEVHLASHGPEALDIFRRLGADLILTDVNLPPYFDGFELLAKVRETDPNIPVLFITGYGTIDKAVEAIQRGATDYITKPFDREDLERKVMKAIKTCQLERENRELRAQLGTQYSFENIIGKSKAMEPIFKLMSRLVESDTTVLIRGESGTGKELVARALHYKGPRAQNRFVAVNCSAIPSNLLETELFGHVKGSFTGAEHDRQGRFEAADKGTIFLDEIGDMPLELQSKILRVLQEREIERVGSQDARPINVRVICATHRNLERMVQENRFRQDLFYRLNVVPVTIPPLRERIEDIPLLLKHFLKKVSAECKIEKDAIRILGHYGWPGNVRELENVVERALILRDQENLLTAEDFKGSLGNFAPSADSGPAESESIEIPKDGLALNDVEKQLIIQALDKTRGNQTRAARLLGITRQTLIYRMQKHEIRQD